MATLLTGSMRDIRVVKRSSTSPLGEPILMLIDVEKEALIAIFDEPKEVGESKRKHPSSSKRGASRQHDDVDYSLALEDDPRVTPTRASARVGSIVVPPLQPKQKNIRLICRVTMSSMIHVSLTAEVAETP